MAPQGAMTTTVTLPAGKDSRGFSLLEMVLVLVVMGISMAIVVPNIGRRLQEREVRSSALSLAAVARDLRSRALLDGIAQQLIVSMPHNTYLVPKTTRDSSAPRCPHRLHRRRRSGGARHQAILFLSQWQQPRRRDCHYR